VVYKSKTTINIIKIVADVGQNIKSPIPTYLPVSQVFLPEMDTLSSCRSDTVAPHRPPKGHLRGTPSNVPSGEPKAGYFNRI